MSLHLHHHNSSVCAAKVRIAPVEKGPAWDGTLIMPKERGRDVAMHLPGLLSGLRNRGAPADGVDTAGDHR